MPNLLQRIFARRQVSPERQPEIRHVQFGNVTVGVNIRSPEEMLKIAAVWRCVSLISTSIATLPWQIRKPDGKGNSAIVHGHTIERLLNTAPNPEMTAFAFKSTFIQHKLLYGGAGAEIEQDGAGRAIALWPIAPDRIDPVRAAGGDLLYRIAQPRGGVVEMALDDMFYVPGMAWDGVRGYSILEVAMQSLGGVYAMDRFAGGFFGHGMQPGGIIEVPKELILGEEAMDRLRKEFEQKHSGWSNAQKALILDQGMQWKATSTDPQAGQFLDTRQFSVYEVARWFGVPPYLAFASEQEPRANVEAQSREFLMYGLKPHITALEQEANRKLFFGYRGPLETRMDVNEFKRGDLKATTEMITVGRSTGLLSINEGRKIIGMEPISGPEGDVRHMQVQVQPIGPDGAPTAPKTGETGESGLTNGQTNGIDKGANT